MEYFYVFWHYVIVIMSFMSYKNSYVFINNSFFVFHVEKHMGLEQHEGE